MDALYICNFGFCADFIFFGSTVSLSFSVKVSGNAFRRFVNNNPIFSRTLVKCAIVNHTYQWQSQDIPKEKSKERKTRTPIFIRCACIYIVMWIRSFIVDRTINTYENWIDCCTIRTDTMWAGMQFVCVCVECKCKPCVHNAVYVIETSNIASQTTANYCFLNTLPLKLTNYSYFFLYSPNERNIVPLKKSTFHILNIFHVRWMF